RRAALEHDAPARGHGRRRGRGRTGTPARGRRRRRHRRRSPMTDLDRDALEAERDFLVRSIDDLDEERAAGNVDDGTYRELHDDYTARAAAVIRSLEAGIAVTVPEPITASTLRRALTAGGIVAFAIIAAILLSHAVGQRR